MLQWDMSKKQPLLKRQRLMLDETRRFLNVEYGLVTTRIKILDLEDLSEIQDAIKVEFGSELDAPPARIQLHADGELIASWKDFMDLPLGYFIEGKLFVIVQVSSESSTKKLTNF